MQGTDWGGADTVGVEAFLTTRLAVASVVGVIVVWVERRAGRRNLPGATCGGSFVG